MSKPNTKKMLTVMISVAMVFSAFAILSLAATPAYAASGSFTTDPTVFAVTSSTVVVFSGSATFTSGSTITFYVNTVNTFPTGATSVGTLTLGAGLTSISGLTATIDTNGLTAGTYYLAATDGSGFASGGTITVSSLTPEIALSGSTQAGGTAVISSVSGHPFDASAYVGVYLNYAGGTSLISSVALGSDGYIPASTTFTVPNNIAQATYNVVAQELTTGSPTNEGITADTTFALTPSISVSVADISGGTGSTFTITGNGFAGSATVASYTSSNSAVTVGGVDALHATATTTSGGRLSLSVTGLATAITTTGPQTIVITTSPATASNSFAAAVYVSSPTGTPQLTVSDTSTSTNNGNVGDAVDLVVLNMLASSTVTITMAGTTLSSGSTDANGFLSTTGTVPAVAGGSYTVFAQVSSSSVVTEAVTSSFTVLPSITYGSTPITGEYAPVGAAIYVVGSGLTPNTEYAVSDSGFISFGGTGNIFGDVYAGTVTDTITVTTGTAATDNMGIDTTATGEFALHYTANYYQLATGSNETVKVTGGSLSTQSTYYYAIGSATVTIAAFSYDYTSATQSVSLTVSGLIPYGSLISTVSGTQPSSSYKLFSGSTGSTAESVYVNGATTSSTTFDTTSGAVSLTFAASALSNGHNTVNIVYSAYTPSTASAIVGDSHVIGSSAGTSAGTVYAVTSSASPGASLQYDLYDFPASTTVTYSYYTISGKQTATLTTDANGAAKVSFPAPMTPAGTYMLSFSVQVSGVTTSTSNSLAVTATLSDVQPSSLSYPETAAVSSLFPGQNVTLYAYGLSPETYYAVYGYTSATPASGSPALAYFTTDSSGSYNTGITVSLPTSLVKGTNYYLDVLPGSTALPAAATVNYTFTSGSYNNIFGPTFNYTSNTESAFPGQLVNFAWTPATPPNKVGTNYGPVEVTIFLNGTAYMTVPGNIESGTLIAGSFPMPNNNTGAFWTITLGYTQVDYATTTVANVTMSTHGAPTLLLVSGAGALITGFNTAQLTAIIKTAIGTSMSVPLSELNASIVSIKGLTANITTAFGTMTSTLSAINATVTSIENGQVLVQTDVGSIMTSFASLNSSIQTFNGDVATINTTLGSVTASLSSINTKVVSNGANLVTVETDLGNISGEITATHGQTSTISTSLGDLNATVAKINTNTSGFGTLEIFLIVIVVLVLITLVLSLMAVTAANKASRRATEEKKQ